MAAAKYNFEIEQGTTFTKPLVWKNNTGTVVNLSGYTARMQVRSSITSDVVLLELTTENELILITPAQGKITLSIDADTTSRINWTKGVYDLEVESSNGIVTRLLRGNITVSKEVTR